MNEILEQVLANYFSGIHKSKIICSAARMSPNSNLIIPGKGEFVKSHSSGDRENR
jgi:hypothetical protein